MKICSLLECSVGVPPASVCRSMSGETPDILDRLGKSETLETLESVAMGFLVDQFAPRLGCEVYLH